MEVMEKEQKEKSNPAVGGVGCVMGGGASVGAFLILSLWQVSLFSNPPATLLLFHSVVDQIVCVDKMALKMAS